MRQYCAAVVIAIMLGLSTPAYAGFSVAGSIGKGLMVKPSVSATQTNLMVAPGFSIFDDILRLEVGLTAEMPDIQPPSTDLEVRPMLRFEPPLLPVYGRAVFAVGGMLEDQPELIYGGALGVSISLGPLGVFGEAGVLPRKPANAQAQWVLEARAGVEYVIN